MASSHKDKCGRFSCIVRSVHLKGCAKNAMMSELSPAMAEHAI